MFSEAARLEEQHLWRNSMFSGASRFAAQIVWRSSTFLKKQLIINKKPQPSDSAPQETINL